jgi:predicted phosphohydrolase
MSKVFVTGDTHGVYDFNKLIEFKENFKERITKEDYVIIAGDFGVVWTDEPDEEEKFTLAWLDDCPWTTLFIDGNHENHPRLNAFPEVRILGGRAHKISKKVYHIMRGEVINIDGLKILCMGGADSHDKHYRVNRKDWWAEERITEADVENARKNLARYNFTVDYVISHSLPRSIQFKLFPYMKPSRSCFLLEEIYSMLYIEEAWITGHYHEDMIKKEEGNYFRMIYQNIIMLQPEGDKYDKLQ